MNSTIIEIYYDIAFYFYNIHVLKKYISKNEYKDLFILFNNHNFKELDNRLKHYTNINIGKSKFFLIIRLHNINLMKKPKKNIDINNISFIYFDRKGPICHSKNNIHNIFYLKNKDLIFKIIFDNNTFMELIKNNKIYPTEVALSMYYNYYKNRYDKI